MLQSVKSATTTTRAKKKVGASPAPRPTQAVSCALLVTAVVTDSPSRGRTERAGRSDTRRRARTGKPIWTSAGHGSTTATGVRIPLRAPRTCWPRGAERVDAAVLHGFTAGRRSSCKRKVVTPAPLSRARQAPCGRLIRGCAGFLPSAPSRARQEQAPRRDPRCCSARGSPTACGPRRFCDGVRLQRRGVRSPSRADPPDRRSPPPSPAREHNTRRSRSAANSSMASATNSAALDSSPRSKAMSPRHSTAWATPIGAPDDRRSSSPSAASRCASSRSVVSTDASDSA